MLSEKAKDLFDKLELDYSPVAIKFSVLKPEDCPVAKAKMSLCQFVHEAQASRKKFCINVENEDCVGKMVLGMVPISPIGASGQAGYDFGVFKTQGANARLYHMIPKMLPGSINYVTFAPTSICDYDPDLVVFIADTKKADIIMRATSYISGDLWESKTSSVVSCAWTYIYPYISGKVNSCITGMHHGMARRKVYPAGLHIISVPYQKLDEVVQALDEMDWQLVAFRDDPESQAELSECMKHWDEMAAQLNSTFSLPRNE